jgi:3-hydroxyisobutyrate dehydrogenase-like beta-hydroxyacid dehydrogenase
MTESIGVVGLGLVGAALAELLITRGYRVVGCDIDPAKNAVLATRGGAAVDTPAEVAARCDRIILSLMTTNIVRHVVEGEKGILSASRPPACIIDTTTGDPVETAALAERLATRGVAYLDATISGSSEQIRRRVGTFMVGGAPETFALHRDLLDVFSDFVFHLGAAGSGSRAKLASNLVLGLNRLVLAEGLVFAERLGLDLSTFLDVLKNSPAYSTAMDVKGRKMIEGDFTPVSRVRQHLKDVSLILEYARRCGQELPLSAAHHDLLAHAVAVGDGDLDNAAVIQEVRRRAIHQPQVGFE